MATVKSDNSRAADVIKNWLRNRNTLEFLGTWEQIYNPSFKVVEFDHFKQEAGLHTFTLSVSDWIEKTDAIGLMVKKGRYGGTFAYKDIAVIGTIGLLDRLLNEKCIDKKEYRDCLMRLKSLIGNGIRLPEEEIDDRLSDYDVTDENP